MTFRFSALALGAIATVFSCFNTKAEELTVDQCIAIALSESPIVHIADMDVTRVDYSRKETLGKLLPSLDFNATYGRMIAKQVMYLNTDAFGSLGGLPGGGGAGADQEGAGQESRAGKGSDKGSDGGIKMGLDNSWSLGFQTAVPLIAPQLWKSIQISDTQILRNLEVARQSRLSLVNQVKSAYYALMLAKDSKRVIQESYDMAALTNEIYTKKYAAGAASDYEVLRTSVALKNIEPQLMQSDVAIKQARLQLLILMGVDADFPLDVKGQLSDYEATMFEDALTQSVDYSGNSDLLLNDIDTKMLDQTVSLKKAAWYPTLAASFNYNWTSMNNGSPFSNLRWNPYSTFGLSLSVPLFQGGSRYIGVKQSEIQLQQVRLQRESLERSVAMQVAVARDNINVNVKQIASCSESVGQAERAHTIMEKSFNIGAASYLDLRDSELALTQSRLAYNQAIYNYLVARSQLEFLLGNAPLDSYTTEK